MKKSHGDGFPVRIFVVVLTTVILAGCTQKGVNDNLNTPQISLSMKITEPALIEQVSQFYVTVTADDMDTALVARLEPVGRYVIGRIDVPAGRGRKFVAEAVNDTGLVIYRSDTAQRDITANTEVRLELNLYPVVPFIKLSPRYLQLVETSVCPLELKVFKIKNLAHITLHINFPSPLVWPDTAVLGPDLSPNDINFSIRTDFTSRFLEINVSSTLDTSIVDTSGSATLATVYFTSTGLEVGVESAVLTIDPISMSTPMGGSIPIGSVFTDECIIEVHPDTQVFFTDPALEQVIRDTIGNQIRTIMLSEVLGIDTLFADSIGIFALTGLRYLRKMRFLELEFNQISDIRAFSDLTSLEALFLGYNSQITNIQPLSGLTNLRLLGLQFNEITDIHPLIQNALHGGLGPTDYVDLTGNPLSSPMQVDTLKALGVTVVF